MAKKRKRGNVRKKPFSARKQSQKAFDIPEMSQFQMFEIMFASDYLIEEPEFRDEFIFDTFEVMDTFQSVSERLNLPPDSSELDEDELMDQQDALFGAVLKQLVTKERKLEIRNKVKTLSERFSVEGRRDDFLATALIGAFLDSTPDVANWNMVGLVRAMLNRHFQAGLVMSEVMESVEEELGDINSYDSLDELMSLAQEKNIGSKAEGLLKKFPMLTKMLQSSTDKIWDKGFDALWEGELVLELFTEEERDQAVEKMQEFIETKEDDTAAQFKENGIKLFFEEITAQVGQICTPERLQEMQKKVQKALNSKEIDKSWKPFLTMLNNDFQDDEWLRDGVQHFLVRVFFGELRVFNLTFGMKE
jgi:hypothetical protein